MAFQTGTSSSIENLLTQLSTFAQANGWTQAYYNAGNNGTLGLNKNNVHVAFRWEETIAGGTMILYQSTASDPSPTTQPWTATGNSGFGYTGTTATSYPSQRCVNIFAGPHTGYYFFEKDSSPAYINVIVEVDAGRYRHFGFGELEKVGTWAGGEYCYGHYWEQSTTQGIDIPGSQYHDLGLDGGAGVTTGGHATLRVSDDIPEFGVGAKWAPVRALAWGNDPDGDPYGSAIGGWRSGPLVQGFTNYRISQNTAYTPLIPIPVWSFFDSNPDIWRLLGYQADVRMCNIATIDPGQVINIAGENWYFFPWVRKQYLENNTEESWNAGVAYRRIDA